MKNVLLLSEQRFVPTFQAEEQWSYESSPDWSGINTTMNKFSLQPEFLPDQNKNTIYVEDVINMYEKYQLSVCTEYLLAA